MNDSAQQVVTFLLTTPFFAVLSATPARETTLSELVWGRVWAGFYPVERNPENARWRIV